MGIFRPAVEMFVQLSASDDANAYIFPNAVTHKRTASLSNQFREILLKADLLDRYRVDIEAPARGAPVGVR